MPTTMSVQIPVPKNWEEFEDLMWDLFKVIWNDPNTQKNGRKGQDQSGVDIWGRPNKGEEYSGVQCKGKNRGLRKKVTKKELQEEIEKAKSFKPKLSTFYLVTTAPCDEKIEQLARETTEAHRAQNLFEVHFWGWEEIERRLAVNIEVYKRHYSQFFSPQTEGIGSDDRDELLRDAQESLSVQSEIPDVISSIENKITNQVEEGLLSIKKEIHTIALNTEYQSELDYAKRLIEQYKPITALDYLNSLRNRIWDRTSDPLVKYLILKYTGVVHLLLNEIQKAAPLFIEALQYHPDDEKAQCNAAMGYRFIDKNKKFREIISSILKRNPANTHAYYLLIQSCGEDEPFKEIVNMIPEAYRHDSEIAMALGQTARHRTLFDEAEKWARISIKNDKEEWPEPRAFLATILLEKFHLEYPYSAPDILKQKEIELITEVIELLTQAWNHISKSEIRSMKLGWIANRSIANTILGKLDEAIEDIEIALQEEATNNEFLRIRGSQAIQKSDYLKAIVVYEMLQLSDDKLEDRYWLGLVYYQVGRLDEAKAILNDILKIDPWDILQLNAWRLLIEIHIGLKESESARYVLDGGWKKLPNNPFILATKAIMSRKSGDKEKATDLINRAIHFLNKETPFYVSQIVVDGLYHIEQYQKATDILATYVDITRDNLILRKYIDCLYLAGEKKKVLKICKAIREKYGPLDFYCEMESVIYEEIGDLKQAEKICQIYLDKFPGHIPIELRLNVIRYRLGDFKEVDKFLEKDIDIYQLNFPMLDQLGNLHLLRGNEKRAVEIFYTTRMRFFNNPKAHLNYIKLFLSLEGSSKHWLDFDEVQPDTAVSIVGKDGASRWIIIEDREESDLEKGILALSHLLAKLLIGKKVGDKILISETGLFKIQGTIKEVKSKYIYAVQETYTKFQHWFPESKDFFMIPISEMTKNGDIKTDFQPLFEAISYNHERANQIEKLYHERKLPVSTIAVMSGRSEIEIGLLYTAN